MPKAKGVIQRNLKRKLCEDESAEECASTADVIDNIDGSRDYIDFNKSIPDTTNNTILDSITNNQIIVEAPNGENNKELNTIEYDNIESGMWIIIEYDEAMFLGKVERKITSCEIHEKCARLRCFKNLMGKEELRT